MKKDVLKKKVLLTAAKLVEESNKKYYIYSHKKYCSSCGAFLGAGPGFQCTEIHTCPTYIKNCYGTY